MKKMNKTAFTIVELVIVIAVVAVLAAVMIPTFGGIIKSANISADKTEAAAITTQLSTKLDGIKSEADIYDAIAAVYGEEAMQSFAPRRSASYGYHYWYDAKTKRVELATFDEISNMADGIAMLAEEPELGYTPFEINSIRSFSNGRFFLIDKGGSEVVDLLESVKEIDSSTAYTDMLQAFQNSADTLGRAVHTNLQAIAIINDYGMFALSTTPTYVYIPEGTTVLGTATYYDGYAIERGEMDFSGVNAAIKLPNGATVGSYGLIGFANGDASATLENTVELHVNTTEEKLGEIFEAYSTDCVIVLPDGARYVVEGIAIYKLPRGSEPVINGLGSSSTEDIEFEISYTDSNATPGADKDYFDDEGNILYLSYDIDGAQLGLTKGITNSMVDWSVEEGAPFTVENGTVTVTTPEIGAAVSAKVTAALKANPEKKASVTVYIVRPNDITLTVSGAGALTGETDNTTKKPDGAGNITFENGVYTFDITNVKASYNPANYVTTEKVTLSLESDTYFTLAENDDGTWTLTLKSRDDGNYSNISVVIKATVGTTDEDEPLISHSIKLNLIDNSSKAFENKPIIDVDKDGVYDESDGDTKMGKDYLFRIGNGNTVTLGQLFNNTKAAGNVVLEILDWTEGANNNIYMSTSTTDAFYVTVKDRTAITKTENELTYTTGWSLTNGNWAATEIDFGGTGVAKIRIGNKVGETYTGYAELIVEVVDGKNVTAYGQLTNSGNQVLLNNITMSSGSSYPLSSGTLFGNGFTFDVTAGAYNGLDYITGNYLIRLYNANIDNAVIVGPVYRKYNITDEKDYNRVTVSAEGISGIYNSYISNASAPVRIHNGCELTIVNTTLKGGSFANIDMRGGDLIIDDLVTINQLNSNDPYDDTKTTVGLGIVVWYEGTNGAETITLKDINGNGTAELTQYNYLANNQTSHFAETDGLFDVSTLVAELFKIDDNYVKNVDGVKWVHSGILSMAEGVDDDNVTQPDGYGILDVSYSSKDGVAFIKPASSYSNPASIIAPAYVPSAQHHVLPSIEWDLPEKAGDKNYIAQTDAADYCYYDAKTRTIMIRFEKDDYLEFDPSILTATKIGNKLDVSVSMNGKTYGEGEKIKFTAAGDYTITYTYIDRYNYRLGESGTETYDVTYTKTLKVKVVLKDRAIAPATFSFAGTTGTTIVTSNDGTKYLSVVGGSNTGTKTIDGKTVTYIKVYVKEYQSEIKVGSWVITPESLKDTDANTSYRKSSTNTAYCPVFSGVVTITDNGTTYDSSTTTLADGKLAMISDPASVLKWASSNAVPTNNPVVKKGTLLFQSSTIQGVTRSQTEYVFEYTYTDDSGETYHYYVGYIFPKKG